ncbi:MULTISPECIES: glutamate synthase large subunit [unclassified Rhodococcus (in: high G+C Gram-positive bacteria)]|uniref:glutamate synthase large subunit n=1 Tax=unclassified Rhodococcus (in: high G+C Gram-positive bacteria) TaxID=192944 RepID=UPI0029541600|nr:glutamate synthase large subunit [Rhodococcus sp. IEGM 1318]MDV8008736.1 glutamate synthase large subunit [Rhodococcus sp. IEGM 1318]MDZ7913654.1 glutamate synthase large subunit [Rhodococcus sp. (in: high G+C Gram-positive bacteria)]
MPFSRIPDPRGLYDPDQETDSCGVAVVADTSGRHMHSIVDQALAVLGNLSHRGAVGRESNSGDGAGILIQLPTEFFDAVTEFELPRPNSMGENTYAAGNCFLPVDEEARRQAVVRIDQCAAAEGLRVIGWREVPVDSDCVGAVAAQCAPYTSQCFVTCAEPRDHSVGGIALDRRVFTLRRRVERIHSDGTAVYFPSLSARTIVYKGMLTPAQLPGYFTDLRDGRMRTALAVVHSRYSTNTFPSWPLAQPYRCIAHNGEINTIVGNRNWMRAREPMLRSEFFDGDIDRLFPICTPGGSDSSSFDEVLELLTLGGRSVQHAIAMMVPGAWENDSSMPDEIRALYQFHGCLMEPWDGPASVTFSDGTVVGAVLDRNGLRPGRWWRMKNGRIVLASESGVFDAPTSEVLEKGRLEPGRMFLVDTARRRIVPDAEIKSELASTAPYRDWLAGGLVDLADIPESAPARGDPAPLLQRQLLYGYQAEDLQDILVPMASSGSEPLGSMGVDTPLAVLSDRPKLLYDYFVQLFAQVTNPPLDAIREEVVTTLATTLGAEQNLFEASARSCRRIVLQKPVIGPLELQKIAELRGPRTPASTVLQGIFDARGGLAEGLERLRETARTAATAGVEILVISDRGSDCEQAPIPSLLAVSSVHHDLVRHGLRTKVSLVVESGDAREVHHIALLIGYGAAAVHPYLALESVEALSERDELPGIDPKTATDNYLRATNSGVLKVMSKMGIATVHSYTGAQVFEAVGLGRELVDEYFCETRSRIGGIGITEVAREVLMRHAAAVSPSAERHRQLSSSGEFRYRRGGELHLFTPESVFFLQHATRSGRSDMFRRYRDEVDRLSAQGGTLRGLFRFRRGIRPPVPLRHVEPVEMILARFNTGAMSYGSLSAEAHETMAVAMNALGGRSNTGEGGEAPERLRDNKRRSAVKQVASGRFGVTSDYLVNATDIQIKMAQGAKPGEGGQLPGSKVYPWIAETRYSTPGVGLISPPPHHDIYSIEDLAQLIYDLRCANDRARIHVKLVSAAGVGTVAAGVAKAHADVVLISGHDGGTGAAALSSIHHAGTPWEIGLAETQQTLVLNGLRDRIVVQCDGGLRTARDVVVAALLGAQEYGFSTAPLIAAGCVMMRVCHLDTCPVGVATQNPELRERFTGRPEYVENFFRFIADDVRRLLAELGFRSIDDALGHADVLEMSPAVAHWKSRTLDLSPLFDVPAAAAGATYRPCVPVSSELERTLIKFAANSLEDARPVHIEVPVHNTDRAVGTRLGAEVTRRYGAVGLPEGTIDVVLSGTAGQSLGAFLPSGISLVVVGDANDYVGKGLSGGRIVLRPSEDAPFVAEEQVIAGNTLLYGATSGALYARGRVGERFAVRNSGAVAVVEGVGDHACEYMTGGCVVILGPTGRNLAAGMSGGIAFVLDLNAEKVNCDMVVLERPSAEDCSRLVEILGDHLDATGSSVAAKLLDDWVGQCPRFTKVLPVDYQKAVEENQLVEPAHA